MTVVHDTAVIDPLAELEDGVEVGAYAVIGPRVTVGRGTTVAHHAVIERDTGIGESCFVGVGSVIGNDPQDLKYRGEETRVEIGDRTRIREYSTINRGTAAAGTTRIGSDTFLMSYVHVAHDCQIGDNVIISNAVQLGGHVEIHDHAVVGGSTPIHQFVRIGRHAFVGGGSRVPRDVPPYGRAAGNPIKLYGINSIGLERVGFDRRTRTALKRSFRLLFNSKLKLDEALAELEPLGWEVREVQEVLDFVTHSRRGITR